MTSSDSHGEEREPLPLTCPLTSTGTLSTCLPRGQGAGLRGGWKGASLESRKGNKREEKTKRFFSTGRMRKKTNICIVEVKDGVPTQR